MTGNTAKLRELVNAIIIDNIKNNIEASTKEKTGYDPSVPQSPSEYAYHVTGRDQISKEKNKNIYKYIDEARFERAIEEAKKSYKDKEAIAEARQLVVDSLNSEKVAYILREDFEEDDIESNIGYCQIVARAIQGIGIDDSNMGIPDSVWADKNKPLKSKKGLTAEEEFKGTLLLCLDGKKPLKDNYLIKGLIGLNQDDINRMETPPAPIAAPSFDKLDRLSEFTGTATNWLRAFYVDKQNTQIQQGNQARQQAYEAREQANRASYDKAVQDKQAKHAQRQATIDSNHNRQLKQMRSGISQSVDEINKIASYQAQIVHTLGHNQVYIKNNHALLDKAHMWTQAAAYQNTKLSLGQIAYKNFPIEPIKRWGENGLKSRINTLKPYKELMPASINANANAIDAKSVYNQSMPVAIDLIATHGVDPNALNTFNAAARGDATANVLVSQYVNDATAQAAPSINKSLETRASDLDRQINAYHDTKSMNTKLADLVFEPYTQIPAPENQSMTQLSSGKSMLISACIGAFQLRSMLLNNSVSTIASRGDRYALEFMSGYASTTLALTTAGLDVVNAGLQVNPARGAWVARLSVSIGLLGAVGAGFEVYSLELSQQRLEESGSTTSVDAITIAQGAAVIAGVGGAMIGLSISLPFLGAIVAVAWGVSLLAQWVAYKYDKSNILPLHYWLDAGVFGNKNMVGDAYPNNPFSKDGKSNMHTLEHDLKAYVLSMTQVTVTPVFTKKVIDFRETLSGKVEVSINQFNANSYVAVDFIKDDNVSNSDIRGYTVNELLTQNKATINEEGILKLSLDIPTVSHYEASYLSSGMAGTYDALDNEAMKQAKRETQNNPSAETKELKVMVIYELNPGTYPHYLLRTSVTSQ